MKGQFCPICQEPALDDSVFCAQHRAQAALFTQTFAPADTELPKVSPAATLESAELEPVRAAVAGALAHLIERSASGELSPRRNPELVLYYRRGQLIARTYFATPAPEQTGQAGQTGFAVHSDAVQAALGPAGVIHDALGRAFLERVARLQSGELAALSIELHTSAGEVMVSERSSPDERTAVARFTWSGDTFLAA